MLGFVTAAFTDGGSDYAEEPTYMDDYEDYIVLDANGDRSEDARSRLNDLLEVRAPAPGYEVISTANGWKLVRPCVDNGRRMKATVDYYDGMWV